MKLLNALEHSSLVTRCHQVASEHWFCLNKMIWISSVKLGRWHTLLGRWPERRRHVSVTFLHASIWPSQSVALFGTVTWCIHCRPRSPTLLHGRGKVPQFYFFLNCRFLPIRLYYVTYIQCVLAALGWSSCEMWRDLFGCVHSRIMTYREHGAWVVKAHLQKDTDGHIISVRYTYALLCSLSKTEHVRVVSHAKRLCSSPPVSTETFDSLSPARQTLLTCYRQWRG